MPVRVVSEWGMSLALKQRLARWQSSHRDSLVAVWVEAWTPESSVGGEPCLANLNL